MIFVLLRGNGTAVGSSTGSILDSRIGVCQPIAPDSWGRPMILVKVSNLRDPEREEDLSSRPDVHSLLN